MNTDFYRGGTLDISIALVDDATGAGLVPVGASVKVRIGQQNAPAVYDQAMSSTDQKTWTHTVPKATTINFNGNYFLTVQVIEADGREWTGLHTTISFKPIVLAAN